MGTSNGSHMECQYEDFNSTVKEKSIFRLFYELILKYSQYTMVNVYIAVKKVDIILLNELYTQLPRNSVHAHYRLGLHQLFPYRTRNATSVF